MDKTDIWSKLAAPLPTGVIAWRQDGKPMQRDGKHFARFVCYIEANTVRERLDSVVPGEWDLTLELLPPLPTVDGDAACSFKARLQILGVIREDVGTRRDYKAAATDASKRAAVPFGIAHELYAFEQNWVQVDSDSKFAKPLEDPQTAYSRRHGSAAPSTAPAPRREVTDAIGSGPAAAAAPAQPLATGEDDSPDCPKCGGRMWDNRATKRNPKAPDYKCRDRSCDGVVWPPKGGAVHNAPVAVGTGRDGRDADAEVTLDSSPLGGLDDIPF